MQNLPTATWNTRRTYIFHSIRTEREALNNADRVRDLNLDRLPADPLVIHNPGVMGTAWVPTPEGELPITEAQADAVFPENHARHDVWAGLLAADALHTYRMQDWRHADGSPTPWWLGMRRAAWMLRDHPANPNRDPAWDGFREAWVNGERLEGLSLETIAGDAGWIRVGADSTVTAPELDMGTGLPELPPAHYWSLGKVPSMPAVLWSARRLGSTVFLVAVHGFRDPTDPTPQGRLGFGSDLPINSVTVLDGPDGPGPFVNDTTVLSADDLQGLNLSHGFAFGEINALVLRIELR